MTLRRSSFGRSLLRRVPPSDEHHHYPNAWRHLRRERGLSQQNVAHYLGHLNVDYYQDVEAGRRFPRARILALLLTLLRVSLEDVYPELMTEAAHAVADMADHREK